MKHQAYAPNVFSYHRRLSREVAIGKVLVGGNQPLRVQSMTTTPTWDAQATIEQTARLVDVGCEIVRLTVPSKKDAKALPLIREGLLKRNIDVPLVADIHFAPNLAMFCCDHVDKVRINPGNYVDSKRFLEREYTDEEYADEVKRIEDAFLPLVLKAKERKIAMRIGTNHGSLSDRILNRYGDTPLGMVESALEYVRVAKAAGYHSLVMSMKSSNPIVMIQAYRLLAEKMSEEDMDYPFHLGVTEAGDGLDARVKSAVGIGSLLADGIGDTIRVSLTEKPEAEVPVGFELASLISKLGTYDGRSDHAIALTNHNWPIDPYLFTRRKSTMVDFGGLEFGAKSLPRVEISLNADADPEKIKQSAAGDGFEFTSIRVEKKPDLLLLPKLISKLVSLDSFISLDLCHSIWRDEATDLKALNIHRVEIGAYNISDTARLADFMSSLPKSTGLVLKAEESKTTRMMVAALRERGLKAMAVYVGLSDIHCHGIGLGRRFISSLKDTQVPILLGWEGASNKQYEYDPVLAPSTVLGSLLCDGVGDALRFPARGEFDGVDPVDVAYTILQATRFRTVRTEYVSCPSCGRTLFDLEETTAKIKGLTGHLPNVKIAIMGCIVNGPGEMADADFGYVGWKPGRVDLYVGKEVVEKAIPEDEAPLRLVELLKRHGVWLEKPETALES